MQCAFKLHANSYTLLEWVQKAATDIAIDLSF
jgi:hypothetical protein